MVEVKKAVDTHTPEVTTRARARDTLIDDFGREIVDPRPLAPPLGYKPQPSIFEIVREAVRNENLKRYAMDQGKESFDEADDFDVDDEDEFFPSTKYEQDDLVPLKELRRRAKEADDAVARREREERRYGSRSEDEDGRESDAGGRDRESVARSEGNAESQQKSPVRGSVRDRGESVGRVPKQNSE